MHPLMYLVYIIFGIIDTLLTIYTICLIVYIILGWLIQLQVINAYKPFLKSLTWMHIYDFFRRWYDPVLNKIRRYMPYLGGIDLSAIVVFVVIAFIQYSLQYYLYVILR